MVDQRYKKNYKIKRIKVFYHAKKNATTVLNGKIVNVTKITIFAASNEKNVKLYSHNMQRRQLIRDILYVSELSININTAKSRAIQTLEMDEKILYGEIRLYDQ
jgi:hypothetical protein